MNGELAVDVMSACGRETTALRLLRPFTFWTLVAPHEQESYGRRARPVGGRALGEVW